eukprot:gene11969-biopygen13979
MLGCRSAMEIHHQTAEDKGMPVRHKNVAYCVMFTDSGACGAANVILPLPLLLAAPAAPHIFPATPPPPADAPDPGAGSARRAGRTERGAGSVYKGEYRRTPTTVA